MATAGSNSAFGQLPDLISYLRAVYRDQMKTPEGIKDASDAFTEWAKNYLAQHRPTEVFAVDNNYGILLTNGQRIRISPDAITGIVRPGEMANPDTSVSIF